MTIRALSLDDLANIPPRERRGDEPIAIDRAEVHVRGDALHPILWRGKQWAVTEFGIEALSGTYSIKAKRLAEGVENYGWPMHMTQKSWVDVDDFCTAWLVAIALFNVRVPGGMKGVREALSRAAPSRDVDPED
jgi:hypothetical protein